jgi:release factor glutamine methyltransferase
MTRAEALRAAAAALKAAGIEEAADDARRLLEHASTLSRAELIASLNDPQPPEEAVRFDAWVARRVSREPLSHILGGVGFWTLDLIVTADVLTPRADTETLVEAALAALPDKAAPLRILDIGTGSGAIALALLSERPNARAIATDLSEAALAVAQINAKRCGLSDRIDFVRTRWADGLEPEFDLVVSNPPYIASAVIETLEPEVRDFEPRLALDGGTAGLDPYPHLFAEARRLLSPGGVAVFEIGYDQGAAALALAKAAGGQAEVRQDLAGHDRALVCRFTEEAGRMKKRLERKGGKV